MAEPFEVDWAAIRAEWENTDITLDELTKRWGFKSDNSIRRRRNREGWSRDELAVAAALAEKAIQLDGGVHLGVRESVLDGVRDVHTRTPSSEVTRQTPASADADSATVRPKGPKTPPDLASEDDGAHVREAGAVAPTSDLVAERVRAVQKHLYEARRGIRTATAFFDLLSAIALADIDSQEHTEALVRLQALNLDKDSLSTIIKSMTGMMESFVKMERQALGMDVATGKRAEDQKASAPLGPVTPEMRALMHLLPENALMEIREASVRLSRIGRPGSIIEGKAE